MNSLPSEASYVSRTKRKFKPKKGRRRFWKIFIPAFLVCVLAGGGFLYGTNQGLQLRKMLLGSVLSYYHPGYEKFLELLLPKSEIDKMLEARFHPQTVQSAIKKIVAPEHVQAAETIKVDTINTDNYTAKVMIIPDPTTVHIVGTKYSYKGQALSDLLKQNNAVAGINAGGFIDPNGQGNGGQVIGIVIGSGKVLSVPNGGRNEPLLVGAILKGGQFITGSYSVNQLLKLGATDAVSFGPQLIVNGKNVVTPEIDDAWGWAPRTAIGQEKNGSIVMIITDGRFYWNKTHRGASMSDMAQMFAQYHVDNAIAMDGGGSTTMIKDGNLLLQPATSTAVGMRYLPNAWVIKP